MTLSLKEDVKLRETENAWKPARMKAATSNEDEAKTEVCIWNSAIAFSCMAGVCAINVLTHCLGGTLLYYLCSTSLNESCILSYF
jgi:hypothetical protein